MQATSPWRDIFEDRARRYGLAATRDKFEPLIDAEELEELCRAFEYKLTNIMESKPAAIRPAGLEPWYSGPTDDDLCWPSLRRYYLEEKKRPEDQVESVDDASNVVVAHTPRPTKATFKGRGLVVGYIQSGKTTNFTAVAAKAADLGYHLVIVLSGIHNSLRKQTQNRLSAELTDLNSGKWLSLTTDESDFRKPPFGGEAALGEGNATGLMVIKKNPVVLRRLKAWLGTDVMKEHLKSLKVLVVDDEADQASVGTATINPLIRDILGLLPRNTFVGYTATPFANVFINPVDSEDFYPRDFILNLPRPEGYFGPEMIFGRADASQDDNDAMGYDMVRIVGEEELGALRPANKEEIPSFSPTVDGVLQKAIDWFFLATAARFARGQEEHSSMLIHTHINTRVHETFRKPLEAYREDMERALDAGDADLIERLRLHWNEESSTVPAEDFQRASLPFEKVLEKLPFVVRNTRIVLDNYKSKDRLDYTGAKEPQLVIAVGANTLSRGLTLEGLVSSIFVRTARAYDTLLQMGRWFGFRTDYEELPRIWMTEELRGQFRHLAQVEHEMRADIDRYQEQNLKPTDVAVRVLTHPSLAITAKMGAAKATDITFTGHTLTTRYFDVSDEEKLRENLAAASELATQVTRSGTRMPESDELNGTVVYDDVPASVVTEFLSRYSIHDSHPNMDPKLLNQFINDNVNTGDGYLDKWTIAFVSGSGEEVELGALGKIRTSRRSAEVPDPDNKRIKTLTNPTDFGLGLGMSRSELRRAAGDIGHESQPEEGERRRAKASDPRMLTLRGLDKVQSRKGILLVYPIDPVSEPTRMSTSPRMTLHKIDAAGGVAPIGIGIGFPEPELSGEVSIGRKRLRTHMAVDLPIDYEVDNEELYEAFETDSEDD